jgi:hypothetical protein
MALVDSGAGRSLLREDIFRKISKREQLFSPNVPVDLYDVNNKQLNTIGVVKLEIVVLGDTLLQEFIVVKAITEDCILGLDALYGHSFIFDGRERIVYRVKQPGQGLPQRPLFVLSSKVAVQPFGVVVVDTAPFGIRFPEDLSFAFIRAPELPVSLRVDPFVATI